MIFETNRGTLKRAFTLNQDTDVSEHVLSNRQQALHSCRPVNCHDKSKLSLSNSKHYFMRQKNAKLCVIGPDNISTWFDIWIKVEWLIVLVLERVETNDQSVVGAF